MKREQAVELLDEYVQNQNLVRHMLAVEAAMEDYAIRFGEQPADWMLAGLLHAIPLAVSISLFAEGSHFEDQLAANGRRAFRFSMLLLLPTAALVAVLGKWLLLAFGESYSSNGLTLLWILVASSLPGAINVIYFSILRVRGRIGELLVIRIVTAVAVLVPSALAAPGAGIVAIGYSWLGAQTLVAIYVLLAVRARSRTIRSRRS